MDEKQEFTFLTQQMKERPINKKKLVQRTVITVAMGIIFGLMACLTFLLLEPVLSNWLHPQEEIEMVTIPEDTDEILPQDMLINEESKLEQSVLEQTEEVINTLRDEMQFDTSAYQQLYRSIYEVTRKLEPSIITVTGVTQDVDWFNDPYENMAQTTGFIIAENNREILILLADDKLTGWNELEVRFFDKTQVLATIKGKDERTGLVILAVEKELLPDKLLEGIAPVSLGRSNGTDLIASPVIALGQPIGEDFSVVYGMITSQRTTLNLADANFNLLTTDIYGSTQATGLLINMGGQVIGIINQDYNEDTAGNLISAIGITELKRVLERMSNGQQQCYLGVKGTEVSEEIRTSMSIPEGAYITEIIMGSPAMSAGIQSGDVIVRIGNTAIDSFAAYTAAIDELHPGNAVSIALMRQGQDGYQKKELIVNLGLSE